MKNKNESSLRNTKIAVIFFVFLALFVGISLIFKVVAVIRASQFDGSRRFVLSVNNGKNTEVLSLSPGAKEASIFRFKGNVAPEQAGKLLSIPIDGYIASGSLDDNWKINSLFMNVVFHYKGLKTNLTVLDLLKLYLLARAIPERSVEVKNVGDTSGPALDKFVGRLVSDSFIEKESQTIQIINGTNVGGLGNRLSRLVSNMGGNVIIVATSDSPRKKSVISYFDKKTYTIERLQKVLGYEVEKGGNDAVSDITIVIGEDGISSTPF